MTNNREKKKRDENYSHGPKQIHFCTCTGTCTQIDENDSHGPKHKPFGCQMK